MKLKRLPEDFQVEELTDVRPGRGQHAFYRLSKRGIGTLEAIDAIARRWDIDRRRIGYGGLKDKHAVTRQLLTIAGGPRRGLGQQSFSLEYLGQVERAFHADDIAGNRFAIVLREFKLGAAELAEGVERLRRDGFPNYFDDQRFGSLGASGRFVAEAWVKRDYEQALRLALCDPTDSDRPRDRDERKEIDAAWGRWDELSGLERGWRREVVEQLRREPDDFRRGVARIDHDQRSLYLAAYQSFLWNEVAASLVRQACDPLDLVTIELKAGPVVFFRGLTPPARDTLAGLDVALPSARLAPEPGLIEQATTQVLAQRGLERRQLKIDYPRDSFFSKGSRRLIVTPENLTAELMPDDLAAGAEKASLSFDLPRGAYATLLVKQLTLGT